MNGRSNILLFIVLISVILTILITFYRYSVKGDYLVFTTITCNPEAQTCFALEEEYYTKVYLTASYINDCKSTIDKCIESNCEAYKKDCRIVVCSEETLEDEEICYGSSQQQNAD